MVWRGEHGRAPFVEERSSEGVWDDVSGQWSRSSRLGLRLVPTKASVVSGSGGGRGSSGRGPVGRVTGGRRCRWREEGDGGDMAHPKPRVQSWAGFGPGGLREGREGEGKEWLGCAEGEEKKGGGKKGFPFSGILDG